MAGGEDYARCAVAVGQRAANGSGRGKGGGDAGNNLKWNAGFGQRGHLFGGAAEDKRIAALEADDAAAGAGVLDHQRVDFFLRDGLHAAALAHIDDLGGGRRQIKNRLRNKVVVQNEVGGLNEAQRLDGQQLRVTGAGADQIDRPAGAGG